MSRDIKQCTSRPPVNEGALPDATGYDKDTTHFLYRETNLLLYRSRNVVVGAYAEAAVLRVYGYSAIQVSWTRRAFLLPGLATA